MGKVGGMSRDNWAVVIGHAMLSGGVGGQIQAYKICNSLRAAIGEEPLTYTLVEKPKEAPKRQAPQPQEEVEEEPQQPQEDEVAEPPEEISEDEEPPEPEEPPQRRGPGRPRTREPPKLVQKKQQQRAPAIEEI